MPDLQIQNNASSYPLSCRNDCEVKKSILDFVVFWLCKSCCADWVTRTDSE